MSRVRTITVSVAAAAMLLGGGEAAARDPGDDSRVLIRGGTVVGTGVHEAVVQVVPPPGWCSGTLITDTTVLTAAHCFCGGDTCPTSIAACQTRGRVRFENVLPVGTSTRQDVFEDADVVIHPDYCINGGWLRNDYALLQLDTPADQLVQVEPMHVEDASAPLAVGQTATLVGYGDYNAGTTGDNCDQSGDGRKRSGASVLDDYHTYPEGPTHGATLMFNDTSIGSCRGDSGGPAINNVGRVVGVASTGDRSTYSTYDATDVVWNWLSNNACPDYDPSDPDACSNPLCPCSPADVSVTTSDSPDPAVAGEQLVYTVTVVNNGPNAAGDVRVVDAIPAGVTYVSDTAGCVLGPPGPAVTLICDLGEIQPSATEQFAITVLLDADLATAGSTSIANSVVVSNASGPDHNATNDTATETTTVVGRADLSLTKSAAPVEVGAGDKLTYNLLVTNSGPSSAANVQLSDTLPAGVTFQSAQPGPPTCTHGPPGAVQCNLGQLAPSASAAVALTVVVDSLSVGTLTNTANVTGSSVDPDSSDNAATAIASVVADFGDAADPPYASRLVRDGPYHSDTTREWLGACVSREADALFEDACDDGVSPSTFARPFGLRARNTIVVTVSTSGLGAARYGHEPDRRIQVSAWVDSDRDGQFDDRYERIFDCSVAPGSMPRGNCETALHPTLPWKSGAESYRFKTTWYPGLFGVATGETVMRLRLSYGQCLGYKHGCVGASGGAATGEVEDYILTLRR